MTKVMMSRKGFRDKLKLVKKWGYQCVVCGRPFENIACVTIEHLVPASRGSTNNCTNTAPSHWRCNKTRGIFSLVVAAKKIEKIARKHKNEASFKEWLNGVVPNRIVPDVALLQINNAENHYHDLDLRYSFDE